jgi:hypothetical protein
VKEVIVFSTYFRDQVASFESDLRDKDAIEKHLTKKMHNK